MVRMKILTVIPTFNEIDALPVTLDRLRAALPESDVLIVDDSSPDGTGQLAEEMAAADEKVHVIHRTKKDGLGGAYIAGFTWGSDAITTPSSNLMPTARTSPSSCRISSPCSTKQTSSSGRDGSRGSVVNWPLHRELISRAGSFTPAPCSDSM